MKLPRFALPAVLLSVVILGVLLRPLPTVRAQAASSAGNEGIPEEQTFVIRDTPQNLMKIEQLIRSLDLPPRQVLIEAHIFDVALDHTNSMGIDWGTIMTQLGRSEPLWQFNQTLGQSGGAGSLRFGTLSNEHFTLLLNGLRSNNRAKSLSNPKIIALSGRKSSIAVEQSIVWTETETTYSQAGTAQTTERTSEKKVPIRLEVVPMIFEDGTMRLKITPEISAVTGFIKTGAPNVESRRADAEIIMNDGETLILGGLITESKSDNKDSVPFFGRIPVVKKLFQRSSQTTKRSELVVFITPNIIGTQPGMGTKFKRLQASQLEALDQIGITANQPAHGG